MRNMSSIYLHSQKYFYVAKQLHCQIGHKKYMIKYINIGKNITEIRTISKQKNITSNTESLECAND